MYVFRMDKEGEMAQAEWHQGNERVNPQPFPPERPRTSERSERVRASREEMYYFCMDNEREMAQAEWHQRNEQVNPLPFPPERPRTSEWSERVRASREDSRSWVSLVSLGQSNSPELSMQKTHSYKAGMWTLRFYQQGGNGLVLPVDENCPILPICIKQILINKEKKANLLYS